MLAFIDKGLSYATSLGGRAPTEIRLFLRYSVGGGLAAVADLMVVWALVEHVRLSPLLAGACSLVVGIIINFSVARYWAFQSRDPLWKQFSAFVTVALAGTAINYGSYAVMVGVFGWWYFLSRALAICAAWLWNYGMNRRITFKNLTAG